MKLKLLASALATVSLHHLQAFCGFYVAKADAKLYNHASEVVLVHHEDKTVLTMANDFRGDPKEFAVVIPTPTFIEKDQIHVAEKALIDHLDAYTAPRLVEYFDPDPCRVYLPAPMALASNAAAPGRETASAERAKSLGVKIEAQYTVGEYDILILSADQSNGLVAWLKENGYRIPGGATEVLDSYIKQKMHFFVAKVNLQEQLKSGAKFLRPIQVAFESPKFMLPIRLGTVNADGPQELFVYALTVKGRVEATNYRTVNLPTGMDIPIYVKEKFTAFYQSMFDKLVKRESMQTLFTEYAWDMNWCDPCAADPLSRDELRQLGVFWLDEGQPGSVSTGRRRIPASPAGAQEVFVTRLHVRYDRDHFPEDLVFQETGDRENFQGRYILRHPWQGEAKCDAAKAYLAGLPQRFEKEAETLAMLTDWPIEQIRGEMKLTGEMPKPGSGKKWWQRIWE